jgi:peptidyl-prolyl cis-trans isomerase C
LFGLVFLVAACTLVGNDLATFKGNKITEKDFKEALKRLGAQADRVKQDPTLRERFLDHLVNQKLVSSKAKAEKYDKSKEFKAKLAEIQNEILTTSYIEHYIERETTDKKLKAFFASNPTQFSDMEVKASHILIKDEAKAKKILAEAKKKGADFAKLAKDNSEGPSSKTGGDLGFFKRGQMVPEFEKAAFAAKKGELVPELVKTQFGFHIIKVVDKKGEGGKAKFADVKDKVKNHLKRTLSKTLIDDLRKVANVKVNKDKIKALKL